MRERAQKVGAKLSIRSNPGAGTEIDLAIPAAVAYPVADVGARRNSRWGRILRVNEAQTESEEP